MALGLLDQRKPGSRPGVCKNPSFLVAMVRSSGFFYPLLGFASCTAIFYMWFGNSRFHFPQPELAFVGRNGTQLYLEGKPFFVNGWNSYWLMDQSVEDFSRHRVRSMFQKGARMGLTVCRTWAFNDGSYHALQVSPGKFDERVFQGLDRVIAEARSSGIRLILSLVNNLHAYGGKMQYVKWAWAEGIGLSASNDSFFFDPSIRDYFKTYLRIILTRKNSLTGIQYKDDPTIFAWELMNEPRCMTDPSGNTLQGWIIEMANFVKSIDRNHLLTVGLEGFYGPTTPERLSMNPSEWAGSLGTDFIQNSKIPTLDFASIHIYPDQWLSDQELDKKLKFVSEWIKSHIEDGDKTLKKPVLITEFGLSNNTQNYEPSHRDALYKIIYDIIYDSAKKGTSGAGALPWQFLVGGMEEYNDDFGMVPWERPETYKLIVEQSCRLTFLRNGRIPSNGDLFTTCQRLK